MRRRSTSRRWTAGWVLGAVVLGATVVAVADDQGPHGALTPQAQLALFEQLGISGVGKPPPEVDVTAWSTLIPADNAMTPERVALGRKLYFDTRLSAGRHASPARPATT